MPIYDVRAYLQRSFQGWCMNLENDCYTLDVDLAGYVKRKHNGEFERPPKIVCLFESKCVDNYTKCTDGLGIQVTPKQITTKYSDYSGRYTPLGIKALQSFAKDAGLPLFLIAYRHFDREPGQPVQHVTYKYNPPVAPHEAEVFDELLADIEIFGVAGLWPEGTEEFEWLTPEQFRQWYYRMRNKLVALFKKQKDVRNEIFDLRDARTLPELYNVLGLQYQRPWLEPERYDEALNKEALEKKAVEKNLSDKGYLSLLDGVPLDLLKQYLHFKTTPSIAERYIRSNRDTERVTTGGIIKAGVKQTPRPEGYAHIRAAQPATAEYAAFINRSTGTVNVPKQQTTIPQRETRVVTRRETRGGKPSGTNP